MISKDKDPERVLKYRNDFHKKRKKELKEEIFRLLGNKCFKCGFEDRRALCIDHVHNDGYQEIHQSGFKNYESYLRKVLESIKEDEGRYQLLCMNCNWIKRRELRRDNLV